jgi:hypothetical protein
MNDAELDAQIDGIFAEILVYASIGKITEPLNKAKASLLALIHQREQAARIDELLVLADTSHLSYNTQRYIDARLTELKGNE